MAIATQMVAITGDTRGRMVEVLKRYGIGRLFRLCTSIMVKRKIEKVC